MPATRARRPYAWVTYGLPDSEQNHADTIPGNQHPVEEGVVLIEKLVFHRVARVNSNWRRRVWRKVVEQVGFEVRPHDLRHSASTRLFIEDRWNPAEVQAYLGHRDPRTTLKIYAHVNAEHLPQPPPISAVE